jgi:hypothetical protein
MENNKSVFETLNAINVSGHTEKKGGLTYLPWAWAWAEVKKCYPNAFYTIYENANGWNYHTDGRTAWVKTGVTIEGLEHIEDLPVMNNRNRSIPLESITSFDVTASIQRSLTKACARHGLGLYIYAGEDLPECEKDDATPKETAIQKPPEPPQEQPQEQPQDNNGFVCAGCGAQIEPVKIKGTVHQPDAIVKRALARFHEPLCFDCSMKRAAESGNQGN